jgi:ABC-type uncharacterized transport system permease subunit
MFPYLSTTVTTSSTAPATAAASTAHFQVTLVLLVAGLAVLGWFIRRTVAAYEARYLGLAKEIHETNAKLAGVAEGLAQVVGQLREANRRADLRD